MNSSQYLHRQLALFTSFNLFFAALALFFGVPMPGRLPVEALLPNDGPAVYQAAKEAHLTAASGKLAVKAPVAGAMSEAQRFAVGLPDVEIEDGMARGVFAPGKFSLEVIQQPEGKALYVSARSGLLTQFRRAANNGVIGLLAHNYLAGSEFTSLEIGQDVWVIFSPDDIRPYRITSVHQYQKLDPSDSHSSYVDLRSGETMSATQVFNHHYNGAHHVTFQTCLEGEGKLNWGLMFIDADPLKLISMRY